MVALPEIIALVKPFTDVTDSLIGNSVIKISLIIPHTRVLLRKLDQIEIKTEMGQLLCTNLILFLVPYDQFRQNKC